MNLNTTTPKFDSTLRDATKEIRPGMFKKVIQCYSFYFMRPPIPNSLNTTISLLVFWGCVVLLIIGSRVSGLTFALVGLAFAFLFLTNYALLHEASHSNLHSNNKVNYGLGLLAGLLFPISVTLVTLTHQGHHLRNRTDYEMFDLIYPEDKNKLWRRFQWYGTLCGTFWLIIVLANFVLLFFPRILQTKLFTKDRSSSYITMDVGRGNIKSIQIEILISFSFFAGLFLLFDLNAKSFLLMYLMAGINWSTRQYVAHAFTKRDVIEGALNLKTSKLLAFILLNGNWDLNHHRRPDVPWIHLPQLGGMPQINYLKAYLRMWTGPKITTERGPDSLAQLPLILQNEL